MLESVLIFALYPLWLCLESEPIDRAAAFAASAASIERGLRCGGPSALPIDPRGVLGTEAHLPHADRLIHAWPDVAWVPIERSCLSAVVLLTHALSSTIPN